MNELEAVFRSIDLWLQKEEDDRQQKWTELARMTAELPPNDGRGFNAFEDALRHVNDEALGKLWREWKAAGHQDLRLLVERELERRKRNRRFRRD